MRSASICFNHKPPLNHRRDGGRNHFRMAGWSPAPSNRAFGPVRAGKPSRPSSRSLFFFVFKFVVQLSICHRHRRSRSWFHRPCGWVVASKTSQAQSLQFQHDCRPWWPCGASSKRPGYFLTESSMMLKSCRTRLASVAVEGKHPKHIVDQVKKALLLY